MEKTLKISNARKILPFILLFGLTNGVFNQANAQSWTKRDIKKTNPANGVSKYVYRHLNEVVSVDSNTIVVREIKDKKERVLNLNDTAIYLETGRLFQGDSRKNFKTIPTKDVKHVIKPGDTIAVQIDTWWASTLPNRDYKKECAVTMHWSEDPKKVVTLYVPALNILLKNKDAENAAVKALKKQQQR